MIHFKSKMDAVAKCQMANEQTGHLMRSDRRRTWTLQVRCHLCLLLHYYATGILIKPKSNYATGILLRLWCYSGIASQFMPKRNAPTVKHIPDIKQVFEVFDTKPNHISTLSPYLRTTNAIRYFFKLTTRSWYLMIS